jgi:hypothetical protein
MLVDYPLKNGVIGSTVQAIPQVQFIARAADLFDLFKQISYAINFV